MAHLRRVCKLREHESRAVVLRLPNRPTARAEHNSYYHDIVTKPSAGTSLWLCVPDPEGAYITGYGHLTGILYIVTTTVNTS